MWVSILFGYNLSFGADCGTNQNETELKNGELVLEFGNSQAMLNTNGKRIGYLKKLIPGKLEQVVESLPGGTKYVRVLLENVGRKNSGNTDWVLGIRDEHFRLLQTLSPNDFTLESNSFKGAWTARIPGDTIVFDLQVEKQSTAPEISITEIIAMPRKSPKTYYSSVDPFNPTYINLFPDFENPNKKFAKEKNERRLGDAVGMFMASWAGKSWICSGFLIKKDLFLTNWHCGGPPEGSAPKWDFDIWNSALIDFSWDNDLQSREYKVVGVPFKNKERDFALLSVFPLQGAGYLSPLKYAPFNRNEVTTIKMIHHPLGLPKQISGPLSSLSHGCKILNLDFESPMGSQAFGFTHNCDTAGGSSGAPIFDQDNDLIGMHHMGYMLKEDGVCDKENKAIWINEIFNFLERSKADLPARLYSSLFQ